MNKTLIEILINLQSDPTSVFQLYEELYKASFYILVKSGTEQHIDTMEFLTYPTSDGITELPIFTSEELILDFSSMKPSILQVPGFHLWPRLLQVIETSNSQVAVNPGQSHGIRLNTSMILGLILKYQQQDSI